MALADDLRNAVTAIFSTRWDVQKGYVVPDENSIPFANIGKEIDCTILYADLADSTGLVDGFAPWFAAEVYKAYLYCAARVLTGQGGTISAYDGDRIMAIFIGNGKDLRAVKGAMNLHYAVHGILNPLLQQHYPGMGFRFHHGIGIDSGKVLAAKTGARGANDLVWVGRAANHAAKLSAIRNREPILATWDVIDQLPHSFLVLGESVIWETYSWGQFNRTVYGTNHHLPI